MERNFVGGVALLLLRFGGIAVPAAFLLLLISSHLYLLINKIFINPLHSHSGSMRGFNFPGMRALIICNCYCLRVEEKERLGKSGDEMRAVDSRLR
jgi:hypothetical protein